METTKQPRQDWWRYGHVWMVIAGPAVVVCAGIATVFLAVQTPDPLVTGPQRRHATASVAPVTAQEARVMMPAVQGRNHAATPVER